MIPNQFFYLIVVLGLLWLFFMLHAAWPSQGGVTPQRPGEPEPLKPRHTRSKAPQPFAGLTHKPPCALCEHEASQPTPPPPMRPTPLPPTNRRPREVDTSKHFCPHAGCAYRGWLGLGNLRANGHPSGGPWRGRVPGACGSIQEACLATVTGAQRCRPSGHHGISEARALLVTLSQPAVRTHVACADQLP